MTFLLVLLIALVSGLLLLMLYIGLVTRDLVTFVTMLALTLVWSWLVISFMGEI